MSLFAGASGPARPQTGATFNYLLVNCPPDTCKNKGGGPGGARPGVPPHPAGSGRAGPGCWGRMRMGIRPSRCGRSPGHKGLFLRALTGTFFKGLEVITRCCFFFVVDFFFPPSEGRYVFLSLSPPTSTFISSCFCHGTPRSRPPLPSWLMHLLDADSFKLRRISFWEVKPSSSSCSEESASDGNTG